MALVGCTASGTSDDETLAVAEQAITDVAHTAVERQSIGNCWLYAQATWIESMALSANPSKELDLSQSYWTYWHWFDQVTGSFSPREIQTGGFQYEANRIVLDRGMMLEVDFVQADSASEASAIQASALSKINQALASGELRGADGGRIRQVFDEAWGLSAEVRAQLDRAFGEDGEATLQRDAAISGTKIMDPSTVAVRYTERVGTSTQVRNATVVDAIEGWRNARYPYEPAARRGYLQRIQRALHDRQPVVITWDVDFNALENTAEGRKGSFNLQTLRDAGGPGRQGGHMTVLEDYEAQTQQYGLLQAGVTLDPSNPTDAAKLQAALADSTRILKLRTKNSWGSSRADRGFVPDFPGYHDLWMDYLDGPIRFCPEVEGQKTEANCQGESVPLRDVMLPPGY
jgi:hypothetical protein